MFFTIPALSTSATAIASVYDVGSRGADDQRRPTVADGDGVRDSVGVALLVGLALAETLALAPVDAELDGCTLALPVADTDVVTLDVTDVDGKGERELLTAMELGVFVLVTVGVIVHEPLVAMVNVAVTVND